jgi:hypothetical protein
LETIMPAPDTHDLVVNAFVVVVMPLIIWSNLKGARLKSRASDYLWREHANFMRVSLLILALLTLFSVVELLGAFGLISPAAEETLGIAVGIPFLFAALALFWLGGLVAVRVFRDWRAGRLGA